MPDNGAILELGGVTKSYASPGGVELHLVPGPDPESAAATIAALLDD